MDFQEDFLDLESNVVINVTVAMPMTNGQQGKAAGQGPGALQNTGESGGFGAPAPPAKLAYQQGEAKPMEMGESAPPTPRHGNRAKEDDIKSNLSSKFNGLATQMGQVSISDGTGFIQVGTPAPTVTGQVIGISFVRIGKTGSTEFSKKDLKHLHQIIHHVDNNVQFLNHKVDLKSSMTIEQIKNATAMDLRGRLDMKTIEWGHPRDNKERTCLCMYVMTDKISRNLKELKSDTTFKAFLLQGNCTANQTRLQESVHKLTHVILNKDPNHVHRDSLAYRLGVHVIEHAPKKAIIPVGVINIPVGKNAIRACVLTVGSKDEAMVNKILKEHPMKHLELLPMQMKRSDPNQFEQNLKQHQMVTQQTKAIKLEHFTIQDLREFRTAMFDSEVSTSIIDVAEAGHFAMTGVAYVQYLQHDQDKVRATVENILQSSPKFELVSVVDLDSSISINTKQSAYSKPGPKFVSKFAGTVDLDQWEPLPTQRRGPAPVPKAIQTKPKSFSEALMQNLPGHTKDDQSSDEESRDDVSTVITGSTGTYKTQRERELAEENKELKDTIRDLQMTQVQMQAKMEQDFQAQRTQMEAMMKTIQNLQAALDQKQQHSQQQPNDGTTPKKDTKRMRKGTPSQSAPAALSVQPKSIMRAPPLAATHVREAQMESQYQASNLQQANAIAVFNPGTTQPQGSDQNV